MSAEEIAEGRARLAALLPQAREDAKMMQMPENLSPLAGATLAGLTEAHFDALVVVPGERGGWHCDLLFVGRPPGVPNSMGSPVAMPFHTREDAEAFAPGLLASVLSMIAAGQPEQEPVFWLHGTVLHLSRETLAVGAEFARQLGMEADGAAIGLARRLRELGLAERCEPEDIDRLSHEQRKVLSSTLHAAAVCGVFVWPLRQPREPNERTARERL
jgi:hypothetical protein